MDDNEEEENDDEEELVSEEDGDAYGETAPLLPIFSSAHLDALPIYNLTHAIRILIVQRCETTISWEQLRSPQISQFLVKPTQQQIKDSHFSRATLYALIANALQFYKEGQLNPGNVGVCQTRALMSELIAVRLLRDYTTRELIDALSYDFDPLQGTSHHASRPNSNAVEMARPTSARTSTLEVAIRAQAKHFLAHPLVVQHLQAIWAGTIVFHSAADSLHRHPTRPPLSNARHYGATHRPSDHPTANGNGQLRPKNSSNRPIRRSVTLYNPKDASLFKLSRLRVPRYRHAFSTVSYAIMLGLFMAVLIQRSTDITALEIVFWFWSAGFMLDEIIGFTEQGFGLYILSVWNVFDLGILFLFCVYYVLRLYGIIIADRDRLQIAAIAYDVLASTAVLLFPRLFSLLDHIRYFSQLLIAFRLMALDLVAILILIAITCSGFFIAFTLSFGHHRDNWSGVAYALFQILMGFTPAAWDVWDSYNVLGQAILALFLIICHFLIVTILVTVLTNSFMTIVKNANEEHQFLFAVNTISSVKSEALFSYIAPSNLVGLLFTPLRRIIPMRQYVHVNRTMIKLTHFPILWVIFAYERLVLSGFEEPTDLIERKGRAQTTSPGLNLVGTAHLFSPGVRVREPSVNTYRKDRALDEVFRKPFRKERVRNTKAEQGPQQRTNVVDSWMNSVNREGGASSPMEQPESVLEHLETARRPGLVRSRTSYGFPARRKHMDSRHSDTETRPARRAKEITEVSSLSIRDDHTGDGDEESIDEEGGSLGQQREQSNPTTRNDDASEKAEEQVRRSSIVTVTPRKYQTPPPGPLASATRARLIKTGSRASSSPLSIVGAPTTRHKHERNASSNTIVFRPSTPHNALSPSYKGQPSISRISPSDRPTPGTKTPKSVRPVLPPRHTAGHRSTPNFETLLQAAASGAGPQQIGNGRGSRFPKRGGGGNGNNSSSPRRYPSMDAIALDLASDIGDNRPHYGADAANAFMSGSFQTAIGAAMMERSARQRDQAAVQAAARRQRGSLGTGGGGDKEKQKEEAMVGRMVLARMNTLEEGFKDILREVKDFRASASASGGASVVGSGTASLLASAVGSARGSAGEESMAGRGGSASGGSIVGSGGGGISSGMGLAGLARLARSERRNEHKRRSSKLQTVSTGISTEGTVDAGTRKQEQGVDNEEVMSEWKDWAMSSGGAATASQTQESEPWKEKENESPTEKKGPSRSASS